MPSWGDLRQQNPSGGRPKNSGGGLQRDRQEDEQLAARPDPATQHQRPVPQVSGVRIPFVGSVVDHNKPMNLKKKKKLFSLIIK